MGGGGASESSSEVISIISSCSISGSWFSVPVLFSLAGIRGAVFSGVSSEASRETELGVADLALPEQKVRNQ